MTITPAREAAPLPGSAPMELIAGNARVVPSEIEAIPGGIVARLSGAGFRALLDATFGGQGTVELRSHEGLCQMTVSQISMQGASTLVTLHASGTPQRVN